MWRVAITIAGLDSGGGAGIHADIKTFAALGVHGATALTCVTAQNTYEVRSVQCLPPQMVVDQVEAVHDDMGIDAGKTGMLGRPEIVEAVANAVARLGFPLVVDPVMVAKSGAPLISDEAVEALKRRLLPVAKVATPNRHEAERLAGFPIRSVEDAKRAAEAISREYGVEAVVVKGGHLEGPAVDVLYAGGTHRTYEAPRLDSRATHGTGCSFSAAIAAGLARGLELAEAVRVAKELVHMAIRLGVPVGRGHWPLNPIAWLEVPAERWRALEAMERALRLVEENAEALAQALPEVQSNLAYAIDPRYARGREDVVAVLGRIVNYGGRARPAGPPAFGASDHVARKVLAAMALDPQTRAAMNIRFDQRYVERARALGYSVALVDRRREPPDVKAREGASMGWVVEEAARQAGGKVPDVAVDLGDFGKEPMITVFGRSPEEVVRKVLAIAR